MKELPAATASDGYLLGFLAGYLAADGHVSKDGTVMLNSATRRNLEWVRAAATRLGLGTYGITTASRSGFGAAPSDVHRIHFVPATLRPELFLLDEARRRFDASSKAFSRLRWVVRSVEPTDREEEVFCAEVPQEHAFALEDNILTGNCFGCGAHGDVFTYEMESGGLSFRDAVEKLAAQAGLEVPRETLQAREEARRRADLYEVIEAACRYFEAQLRMPGGKEGLAYLRRRGLDDGTIARFRLGWAPAAPPGQPGPLRAALAREGIDDGQLVEAGLLKRRDDGSLYDYFRDRVLFPITDKRGRVIAFGGRILTDAQPKYLNSPDTPLFHKGTVLYGLAQAREAAAHGREIIVTEGYMDVIALARAGFPQAVAPLGTALTETQIEELWKLVDEPLLCFDGDAAGQRAAARAADRALPLLRPGKSLRFALVPGGQDPDDLIRDSGPQAMRDVLDRARPLLDVLWSQALEGRSLETPERRAALEADLDALVQRITDRAVQTHYRSDIRDRLWQLFRGRRGGAGQGSGGQGAGGQRGGFAAGKGRGGGGGKSGFGGKGSWQPPLSLPPLPQPSERTAEVLRHRILLATLISHPALVDAVGERLGLLEYPDARLDKLRGGVLMVLGRQPALDSEGLVDQLRSSGFGEELDSLLNSDVFAHARFARPDADLETARRGWENAYDVNRRKDLRADGSRIVERIAADPTDEACEILRAFKQDQQRFDDE
ncbi:DNA primase [Novispirillum sp. DQ9]|uniref:DNA primase n=1 Tax=Novispirillum sp. DQ9 TaxID=3398612 RepID=UPI003C7AF4F0